MATFLEGVGFLSEFSIIFPFILIIAVVYGLAQYTKMLGTNKGIHAIIALAIAALFLFSSSANEVIKIITPWFVILFVFILFLMTGIKMVSPDLDFKSIVGSHSGIAWWMISIALIITLGGIANVFSGPGQPFGKGGASEDGTTTITTTTTEGASSEYAAEKGEFWGTLFHPKVLGMVVLLFIASYTVRYLAAK